MVYFKRVVVQIFLLFPFKSNCYHLERAGSGSLKNRRPAPLGRKVRKRRRNLRSTTSAAGRSGSPSPSPGLRTRRMWTATLERWKRPWWKRLPQQADTGVGDKQVVCTKLKSLDECKYLC